MSPELFAVILNFATVLAYHFLGLGKPKSPTPTPTPAPAPGPDQPVPVTPTPSDPEWLEGLKTFIEMLMARLMAGEVTPHARDEHEPKIIETANGQRLLVQSPDGQWEVHPLPDPKNN